MLFRYRRSFGEGQYSVLDWKSITIYIERRKGVNRFDKTPEALAQEGQ